MPRRAVTPDNTTPLLTFCRHCQTSFPTEDATIEGVCPECLEELYSTCDGCGELHHVDTFRVTRDTEQALCPTCVHDTTTECEDCHEVYANSSLFIRDVDGVLRCPRCGEDYRECQGCGRYFHIDDLNQDEIGDEYCWSCESGTDESGIHSYSFKPEPLFHRADDEELGCLVFGIELEMDGHHPAAAVSRISSEYGDDWLYFKHDSSLTQGAELVTHPISPKVILSEDGRKMWLHICKSAKAEGMKSHDARTCGLHVHVNRDYFGTSDTKRDIAEYKLLTLMDRFYEPMVIFSRRRKQEAEHWARKCALPKTEDNWVKSAKNASSFSKATRYLALNTTNRHTIEFRIFRGTLKAETLFATFEFLTGLCTFAKKATPGRLQTINWYELVDEVIANCPYGTSELEAYLIERELMTERMD